MEKWIIIRWPESQKYMDMSGFKENSYLITESGQPDYFVKLDWYREASRIFQQ